MQDEQAVYMLERRIDGSWLLTTQAAVYNFVSSVWQHKSVLDKLAYAISELVLYVAFIPMVKKEESR